MVVFTKGNTITYNCANIKRHFGSKYKGNTRNHDEGVPYVATQVLYPVTTSNVAVVT